VGLDDLLILSKKGVELDASIGQFYLARPTLGTPDFFKGPDNLAGTLQKFQ
jgi:hypothetical protein